jgi:hypothetical protein
MWDKERRGKVVGYINDALVSVRWFPDAVYQESTESWHETNLMHVSPKESVYDMIKVKPIESEYPIAGGSWQYIVVNTLNKEAIAAFTTHEDAEEYVDGTMCREDYTIREVDNS